MGTIWETGFGVFLLVTVALGGGAAYMSGRAVAVTWRSLIHLLVYVVALTAAVRFIHYGLFRGTLLSLQYFAVDLVVLLAIGSLGFRITRAGQMATQYSWLYRRTSPISWRKRPEASPSQARGRPSGDVAPKTSAG